MSEMTRWIGKPMEETGEKIQRIIKWKKEDLSGAMRESKEY
jgi:hypothetical protein